MGGKAVGWAFDQVGIPPPHKLVLVAIADMANGEGEAWPSKRTLIARTGLSERAVKSAVTALAASGFLERVERRRANGSSQSNLYRLPHPAADAACQGEGAGDAPHPAGDAPLEPFVPSASAEGTPPVSSPVAANRTATTPRAHTRGSQTRIEGLDEVKRLCGLMEAHANEQAETPERKRVTQTWLTEMDRLLRLDHRTPEQVEYVIRWIGRDDFWRANVLSVPKLRQQFDQLVAQIKAKGGQRVRREASRDEVAQMAKELMDNG